MSLEIVSPHDGHRQHGRCVLLLEADAAMRHFLSRVLERHGLDALQVETLEEALLVRLHQQHPVAAVICDESLRHGDDRHAIERLVAVVPAIPLVPYGFGASEERRATGGHGGGHGAPSGVPHPFDGDAFADRLWRAIRSARSLRVPPPGGGSGGEHSPDITPGDGGRHHPFDQRDHA